MAENKKRKATKRDLPVITFVTGNPNKLKELEKIMNEDVEEMNFKIVSKDVDLPELQGTPETVSLEKCKLAVKQVDGPTIIEDTALCYEKLNGMPGVYIKWFLSSIGHVGLNDLLAAYDDKSAWAQCTLGFCWGFDVESEPRLFVGRCDGEIVNARGPNDFGWDPIFQPKGYDQTYAEMDNDLKNKISHRGNALRMLKEYLKDENNIPEKFRR